jgi:2-dehydro-3-deoxy-D-arabinonate dehydratase
MHLTRHQTTSGPRWAADGHWLPEDVRLDSLLRNPYPAIREAVAGARTDEPSGGALLAPIEDHQEVWAAGVTYLRSREARMAESETADVYDRVYEAERVEVFFKANGWRVVGHRGRIRVRPDSTWDVPEPELALVLNRAGEIVGYAAGNDVSSRSIEGENPLYLPQSKIFLGCTALGPTLVTTGEITDPYHLDITARIRRNGTVIFEGSANTDQIRHPFETLTAYLVRNNPVPVGTVVSTGTGIIVTEEAALQAGDIVEIEIDEIGLLATPVRQLTDND